MAKNLIADTFKRVLWTSEDIRTSSEVASFINSKIITNDVTVSKQVNAQDASNLIYIPYVQEDLYSESAIMNESGVNIVSDKITKKQAQAFIGFYAKSWTETYLANKLGSGIGAIDAARALMARHWKKDLNVRMLNSVLGCIADNKASHASDNVLTDTVNSFSYELVVDTLSKVGESMDQFVAMAVHPLTYAKILKNNALAVTAVVDELGISRKFYNDMELIVSDLLPAISGVGGVTTSVFFKAGAFVYADKDLEDSVVVDVNNLTNNGAGETTVISKMAYLLHVNGYTFTAASVASISPSIAELASAANWDRLVDAKQAPFVVLESKY